MELFHPVEDFRPVGVLLGSDQGLRHAYKHACNRSRESRLSTVSVHYENYGNAERLASWHEIWITRYVERVSLNYLQVGIFKLDLREDKSEGNQCHSFRQLD